MLSTPVPTPNTNGRAGAGELVEDEAGEHLRVGHRDAGGQRRRPLRAGRDRRREHQRHAQLGAGDDLVAGDVVEHERRRGHGEAGEAAGLAARRRHVPHDVQRRAAEGARDDDGLAGRPHHRVELGDVDDGVVDVLGQPHRHDEVEVGQALGQRRGARDVGETRAAARARAWFGDVEAVRPGAEPRPALAQFQR